jgi:hypothetical protein
MKALTLWEPWATAIALGFKHYETRSWAAPHRYLGCNLAIHASKKHDRHLRQFTDNLVARFPELAAIHYDELPFGCVVVAVRLVNCHRTETIRDSLTDLELALGDYGDRRFAWELEIVKLPESPIPATGKQGLWEWHYTQPGQGDTA